jgi:membrane protease YdiL (CAAX protease family)
VNEPDYINLLSILLFAPLAAGSIYVWIEAARRLAAARPLIAPAPRQDSRTDLCDVLVAVLFLSVGQISAAQVVITRFNVRAGGQFSDLPPAIQSAMVLGSAVATSVAFVAAIGWLGMRYGTPWRILGLRREWIGSDVLRGTKAFLLMAPVVYGIQYLLAQWTAKTHPIIELLLENPDPRLFILSAITAVVVAPLAEELLFRFLLQGWLERIAAVGRFDRSCLWNGFAQQRPEINSAETVADEFDRKAPGDVHVTNSFRPLWPIFVSSLLFAVNHLSHGPAPVPLFVFALGLGYLYRQTQRLLPCIVTHLLLNSSSLIMLGLYVIQGKR